MTPLKPSRLILTALCVALAYADVFLHNPRGSNNRLDEAGRAGRNAKRLFNSQDNNRGGYNVGGLHYYSGSKLNIEWTNQHSCNNPNANCEIVLQYMCGDLVRDGASTRTIPENLKQCKGTNCETDYKYGMHEDFTYWTRCKQRARNSGLFTADQNLEQDTARATRQNPDGTRRGYECPEERDYYPYWHPTPWRDIAILTNNKDADVCAYYQQNSENVKGRYACHIPLATVYLNRRLVIPNNQADCEAFRWPAKDPNGVTGEWIQYASHDLPPPECVQTPYNRDNHLGNTIGGQHNIYEWTVPDIEEETCILRIRYNISTNDYDSWNTDASSNGEDEGDGAGPTKIDLSGIYGFNTADEAAARGYVFENNPQVDIFPGVDFTLQLAINTAQYGRTFQDRSFTFAVRKVPDGIETGVPIHNLNVRGKRGNIVEVYPSVEYDFVPDQLHAKVGDYIHVQWTGSNTNPGGNDGEGLSKTDRNNLVFLRDQVYPEGTGVSYGPGHTYGHYGVNYPMHLNNATETGFSYEDLMHLAQLSPGQFGGEMSQLDDAGTYFEYLLKLPKTGTYHYMCSRNNNFSNRDQKGRWLVHLSE